MPNFRADDAVVYQAHGSTFASFISPARGSSQLCAWRLTVPADQRGVAHRPSREEVLLVLAGEMTMTLNGTSTALQAGDVALVPADAELCIDSGPKGLTAWVTTTPGLEAVLPDGSRMSPPWAT